MGDMGCKVPLCQAVLSCGLSFALSPDHHVTALSASGRTRNPFLRAEKWRLGAVHIAPGASSSSGGLPCQVADVCLLAVSKDGDVVVGYIATASGGRLCAA